MKISSFWVSLFHLCLLHVLRECLTPLPQPHTLTSLPIHPLSPPVPRLPSPHLLSFQVCMDKSFFMSVTIVLIIFLFSSICRALSPDSVNLTIGKGFHRRGDEDQHLMGKCYFHVYYSCLIFMLCVIPCPFHTLPLHPRAWSYPIQILPLQIPSHSPQHHFLFRCA